MPAYTPPSLVKRWKVVTNRGWVMGANTDSDGVQTQMMAQLSFVPFFQFSAPRIIFTNWNVGRDGSGETIPASGPLSIIASLASGNTQASPTNFYQATLAGEKIITVPQNQNVITDPIDVECDNTLIQQIRYFLQVAPGSIWSRGTQFYSALGDQRQEGQNTLSDLTMGGSISGGGAEYGPAAILGLTNTPKLALACLGDSISAGQGDSTNGTDGSPATSAGNGDGNGNWGWIQRSTWNNNVPCMVLSKAGDQASFNILPSAKKRNLVVGPSGLPVVDWVTIMLGVNDATNGQTYTQLKNNLTAIIAAYQSRGVRVCICSISPKTTSTDSWVTTGNQTFATSHGLSDPPNLVNTDLRGGNLYGADAFYDFAAQCESSVGSCLWGVDAGVARTADGLHPNQARHIAIASDFATNMLNSVMGPI